MSAAKNKTIRFNTYIDYVKKGFTDSLNVKIIENKGQVTFQEDVFKWRWLSRVRFNSFVIYDRTPDITAITKSCMQLARKARSKLAEPVTCNVVIVTRGASKELIEYAQKRPPRHMTVSEYRIVVDLDNGEIYYYTGPIYFGIIYEKFEREYIDGHFGLPLRILSRDEEPLLE